MEGFGFIRVAAAAPKVRLADTKTNATEISRMIEEAWEKEVSIIVFPELSITGATCADLKYEQVLITEATKSIEEIAQNTSEFDITTIIGSPLSLNGSLENCAIVIHKGEIHGIVPQNSNQITLFQIGDAKLGLVFGDDLWSPIQESSLHAVAGANIIVNLASTPATVGKNKKIKKQISYISSSSICAYVYASAGYGESTQDDVYSGDCFIYENGEELAYSKRFQLDSTLTIADIDLDKLMLLRQKSSDFQQAKTFIADEVIDVCEKTYSNFATELYRKIDSIPFIPKGNAEERASAHEEIINIQTQGLASRLSHINCETAVLGISGGLDSTYALLITCLTFDKLDWSRDKIIGVTMPGYGTSGRTYKNAIDLMHLLGVTVREISITAACDQHFQDIEHDPNLQDITYENAQARERTQILMDIANQTNGLVVGTGDLSELALGWTTYNGDHMSMYAVNVGVPKTLIMHLIGWIIDNKYTHEDNEERTIKEILLDIIDTPISPELLPGNENGDITQVTEDVLGPYELHDFFLYNFVHYGFSPSKILFLANKAFSSFYSEEEIKKWLRTFIWRFFSNQFKRSCLPDGPRIGSVSLSPRGAWSMPSDAKARIFLEDIE